MIDPRPSPPGLRNIIIALFAMISVMGCLWVAAHVGGWWLPLAAAGFAFSNFVLFQLMHEAVHGIFHRRRLLNEIAGSFIAALFPHAFCLQRAFHLSHHRNNRTDREFFDGYQPDDSLFLKRWQWYGILIGEYWLRVPVACILWLVCPWALRAVATHDPDGISARSFGGIDMLHSLERMPPLRSRVEVIFAIAAQIGLCYALGLTPLAWLACYGAFAIYWGGHQYAVHAWSVREIRNGAWNLRVPSWIGVLHLNVYDHLAHHQDPHMPWTYLPKHRDPTSMRPSFIRQYLSMWRGPRPAWGTSPQPELPGLDDPDVKNAARVAHL